MVLYLYTFATSTLKLIMSLFTFHIYCFKPDTRIFHLVLIHNAIVTNPNLTVSLIFLPITFSLSLKLSHRSTSLLLETCFVINEIVDMIIFLNFLKKILYKINNPRYMRRVIALT